MTNLNSKNSLNGNEIAVIGMAGRFPKARDLEEFWQNLYHGVEGISFSTPEEFRALGLPPELHTRPNFIPAKGYLEDIEWFDAAFFDYSPRDAQIIDPQQRLFLECAWQALEHAGYDPLTYPGSIGLYAGVGLNTYYTYLMFCLSQKPELREVIDSFQLEIATDKDYLTTRTSYKLNLRGPSINVQTACSTSLVAVHLACQSILNGECDIALAGGVSVHVPQERGYFYEEGSITSPDGHCRTFDAQAKGTVSGSGLGIVVLKRLDTALADRDTIHAVIKGTACNNDGAFKIGYTAPSIQGQAEVIAEAIAVAEVEPETISYIEAHGTATPLGDPIEIAGLTQAFCMSTARKNFCAIGSVKSNIGHLGAAAGVAGLLKTILSLEHQMLPPSLHFQTPNPQIDFANSPFYVNHTLSPWQTGQKPRRAGVSSFGIGGTNAHVLLEEAPQPATERASPRHPWHLLLLSARTATALSQERANLSTYLQEHPRPNLGDIAYTLQVGRSRFPHRQVILCRDQQEAIQILEQPDHPLLFTAHEEATAQPVAFLFPGQGSQYLAMGREFYQKEPLFRREIERGAQLLRADLGLDVRDLLYPSPELEAEARQQLNQTWLTQPVLFLVEYALAQLWQSQGVTPSAMLGHSVGEYVAACLAGVFPLEVALKLMVLRGRLMQQMEPGVMLAVHCSQADVEHQLQLCPEPICATLSLAATNTPQQCVVAGLEEAISAFERQLQRQGLDHQRLQTERAFHSELVEPMMQVFKTEVQKFPARPPRLRYISNVTGTWITSAQATDPEYWVQHLRQEVRFSAGIETLLQERDLVFLEVGPGRTLGNFVRQHLAEGQKRAIFASLRRPREGQDTQELAEFLTSLGQLWLAGVKIDWQQIHADEACRRIPLPTYPFERQRYWIELPRIATPASASAPADAPLSSTETREALAKEEPVLEAHRRPALSNPYIAPRNALESQVAEVWERLLGISQIGVEDNFFDLGGHSLLATQITSRLRSSLQLDLPVSVLLENLTIASLALAIEQKQQRQEKNSVPEITRAESSTDLLEHLEEFSDEDIDALLRQTLLEE